MDGLFLGPEPERLLLNTAHPIDCFGGRGGGGGGGGGSPCQD